MNILFFLTPKSEVAYISEEDTLRQALEKMEYHKYSAIPLSAEQAAISELWQKEICSGVLKTSTI